MAKIEYLDLSAAGKYNDGDQVERDILEYAKTVHEDDYWKVFLKDRRWPVFYHLTDMRENILNWYDFAPDSDILEIGAGMGALTGLLCKKGKTVTAVELTKQRADVIYARHSHFDNLTILVGNFNDIRFDKKYDYITLIGVLEYAKGFIESGRAEDFLEKIRLLLKPHGKILIAIENRFGCKYWCGAKEDHLGKAYIGINGYPGVDNIQTYSRQELSDLLDRCGLSEKQFYYPLPDYKLPQMVYSDRYLPGQKISGKVIPYYPDQSTPFSDELKIYEAVIQNRVFPFFANSFFVECGEKDSDMINISYASFTPGRRKRYKTVTVIRDSGLVEKQPENPFALEHLKEICENQEKYHGKNLVPYEMKNQRLEMPFLQGKTLESLICESIRRKDLEETADWLGRLYQCIRESSRASQDGEDLILENGFLDMTPMNCFVQGGELRFFDQEWVEKDVPASFLFYRAIRTFYTENPEMEGFIPQERILEKFGIDSARMDRFHPREQAFLEKVEPPEMNPLAFLSLNRARADLSMMDGPIYSSRAYGALEKKKEELMLANQHLTETVKRQTDTIQQLILLCNKKDQLLIGRQ